MNYDELVKRLREHNGWALNETLDEAADAIQFLQGEVFAARFLVERYRHLADKSAAAAENLMKSVQSPLLDAVMHSTPKYIICSPKWISVKERLPDAECGDFSKNVFVTDGQGVAVSSWFNGDDLASYWSYTGIGEVTHWMPLPEPPKEET